MPSYLPRWTLLRDSPERVWRRCGVIALEDIGVADLVTAGKVVAALGGKTFRAKLGGEWAVASTIVSAMARAPKCRSADDVLMILERHSAQSTSTA
jgi:replication-associated recombination protein RarA